MTIFTHDPRITPARADLAAEHLTGVIAAPRYARARLMRVAHALAPLSQSPARDIPIDTQALRGESVDVYEIDQEGWAWGQLRGDKYVGYMPAEALREDVATPTHRVSVIRTFVYPGPNMKLPPLMALSLGAAVAVRGGKDAFSAVEGGYVWRAHLAALDAFESDFVAVAERFLHAPYLWGGKTSQGIDCSGLVQVSLGSSGRACPRDSDMAEKALGTPLAIADDLSSLRRGDLIYWKGHCGIMRDADELLHANGHHMLVASEPLRVARDRIRAIGAGPITSIRRL